MDDNERIDSIKSKILERIDEILDYNTDTASIKNLVESYEILVNLQEDNF